MLENAWLEEYSVEKNFEGLLITTDFHLVDYEYQYTSRKIKTNEHVANSHI